MKIRQAMFWALGCGVAIAATEAAAQLTLARGDQDAGARPTIAPVLADVTAGVVNISVTSSAAGPQNPLLEDPFFRRFFEVPEQSERIPQVGDVVVEFNGDLVTGSADLRTKVGLNVARGEARIYIVLR